MHYYEFQEKWLADNPDMKINATCYVLYPYLFLPFEEKDKYKWPLSYSNFLYSLVWKPCKIVHVVSNGIGITDNTNDLKRTFYVPFCVLGKTYSSVIKLNDEEIDIKDFSAFQPIVIQYSLKIPKGGEFTVEVNNRKFDIHDIQFNNMSLRFIVDNKVLFPN